MDYTIFYVIGIVVFIGGITYGIRYAKKNKLIDENDIALVKDLLGITNEIVDELNLKQEEKLMTINNVILESVIFAEKAYKDEKDKVAMYGAALEYAKNLCKAYSIEITENRAKILDTLISIAIEERNF